MTTKCRLACDELESRLTPAICKPTGYVLDALAHCRNWIIYAPSRPYNPDLGIYPNALEIREDLKELKREGWRGIITYSLDYTLALVPKIAKQVGFRKVIAGLYWYDDAQLAHEKAAVSQVNRFVKAYVLGNEGLLGNRYTRTALETEIGLLQDLTGKPVATSETGGQYISDPTLVDVGDWVFPNIHPWFAGIRDIPTAVTHTVNEYQAIQALNPDRLVVIKETWWPTGGGDAAATEENQVAYFQQLAQQPVKFIWGEAFDNYWKTAEGPQGPHWGFHTDVGAPKQIIGALHAVYTAAYPPPPVAPHREPVSSSERTSPTHFDAPSVGLPLTKHRPNALAITDRLFAEIDPFSASGVA